MLHTVCYISNAVQLWKQDQLNSLFASSKSHNLLKNVTGLLFYSEGTFVQVLEGESDVVHGLFDQIQNDPRHNQITIMMDREIDHRLFNNYQTGTISSGDEIVLDKLRDKIQIRNPSRYTKSIWAIVSPFFNVKQTGMSGYGT